MILHILETEVCGPHHLRLKFSDGVTKRVDVRPLMRGPIFEPLRDPAYFATVELDEDFGAVQWPNGADFAPEALHALADIASGTDGPGSPRVPEPNLSPSISATPEMSERREKRKRWVQRGQYAVEVEVEVIYATDGPSEPCLEPATVHWLDEIARRAEAGDIDYLRNVGRVFQAVAS